MRIPTPFAWLFVLAVSMGLAFPCAAAQRRYWVRQQKEDRPPKVQQGQQQKPQQQNADRPLETPGNEAHPDRPPVNGQNNAPRGNANVPRPAPPPFVDRLRDMPPEERERVLENNRQFQRKTPEEQERIRQQFRTWDRLTPQQREDLRTRERIWTELTPTQREHIRNDVLPAWRHLPPYRKQAIMQRLRVLQNMPESARNERLNDPHFTVGLSEEDRAMLRDLSHLHIGMLGPAAQ